MSFRTFRGPLFLKQFTSFWKHRVFFSSSNIPRGLFIVPRDLNYHLPFISVLVFPVYIVRKQRCLNHFPAALVPTPAAMARASRTNQPRVSLIARY